MLRALRIRDLAIIDELAVEFGPGLNVLTGETGAGKSILVDALGLVAGQRADRGLVRAGAERAVVEALFEVEAGSALADWAASHGVDGLDDGEVLVRREIALEGSGRAFLNGSPAAVSLLREVGSRLLEVHGQNEQRNLLDPERQLALLDRFGGHLPLATRVREACAELRSLRAGLVEVAARAAERAERFERLAERRRELEELRPRAAELEDLERERRLLRNSGRVAELLDDAVARLYDGEPAASGLAASGLRRVLELADFDTGLLPLAERLRVASLEIEDVGAALRDYRERSNFDPKRLEAVEARRAVLERCCLRHGVDEAGLVGLLERTLAELGSLESLDEERAARERDVERAEGGYLEAARALAAARRDAARRLIPALEGQFAALALERARFDLGFGPPRGGGGEGVGPARVPLTPSGGEVAEFRLAANPGEPLAPLAQVASGGELSRVLLALHVVGGGDGERRVVVFDEVDVGIGGAVADAVGARLSRLGGGQQVLCVTHLPQVAAWADRHFRVHKHVSGGRTRASLDELEPSARVEELARMLGGRRTTETSRRHAAELLAIAATGATAGASRRRA